MLSHSQWLCHQCYIISLSTFVSGGFQPQLHTFRQFCKFSLKVRGCHPVALDGALKSIMESWGYYFDVVETQPLGYGVRDPLTSDPGGINKLFSQLSFWQSSHFSYEPFRLDVTGSRDGFFASVARFPPIGILMVIPAIQYLHLLLAELRCVLEWLRLTCTYHICVL